jgi:hypothetical protein
MFSRSSSSSNSCNSSRVSTTPLPASSVRPLSGRRFPIGSDKVPPLDPREGDRRVGARCKLSGARPVQAVYTALLTVNALSHSRPSESAAPRLRRGCAACSPQPRSSSSSGRGRIKQTIGPASACRRVADGGPPFSDNEYRSLIVGLALHVGLELEQRLRQRCALPHRQPRAQRGGVRRRAGTPPQRRLGGTRRRADTCARNMSGYGRIGRVDSNGVEVLGG